LLAIGGPFHRVVVWDWAAKKEPYRFVDENVFGSGGYMHSLAFTPDGKILAAPFHGTTLWDMTTGKDLRLFGGPHGPAPAATALAFSADGRLLAVAADGIMSLYDPRTAKRVQQFDKLQSSVITRSGFRSGNEVTSLAFSPDGKSLLSGVYDGKLRLWETATAKQRHVYEGHQISVHSVAITPDGRTFASASGSSFDHHDNSVRLWDAATGKELQRFTAHQNMVASIAFSADGRTLASGSLDGTTLIWDVRPFASTPAARPRKLSEKELASLWAGLAGDDAAKAYATMQLLIAAAPDTITLLESKLQPAAAVAGERIDRWINDLDSDQFAVRSKASHELAELAGQAEPALRKRLRSQLSVELRRRIEGLLDKLEQPPSGDEIRALRAIEVLEHIGTTEAQRLLRSLARGAAGANSTREAQCSLERLTRGRSWRSP